MPEDTFSTPTVDTSLPSTPIPSSGNKNLLPSIIGVLILAIVLLIIFWPQGDKESVQNTNTTTTSQENINSVANGSRQADKTFTIIGKNFSFSETELRVKQGEKVKVVFKNEDGFHDFVIDGYNVRTPQLPTGQESEIEFTADKTGEFEYYCSVGRHREQGMKGKLIVE